ncbi:glycosyltransferase family 39 protein [Streptomyces sp. NBC_00829]|uniref:glycosyltransferase family 39 protein n=1 Tax=Streptomyces sp. NBC_00829 TaxID=2903679 RepID=UPI00386B563C|nr:glycosyltransferase family 39 protein [Streptomyces sp. NBC_00829]
MALLSPSSAQDRTPPARDGGGSGTPAARDARGILRSVWIWPTLITFVLTVYQIGIPQLWEDELNSWDMAARGTGELLSAVRNVDAVLGAYYLFLHGWMAVVGESATAVRLPSALAMAGATACTALIGRRLFGRRAGLTAGLLFTLVPVVTRYGHEARPYALVVLAVALSTLLLLRALDRPGNRWRWAGYTLSLAAVGLLHLVALTALAGHLVVVALHARSERRTAVRFGLAALIGVAASAPVALLGRAQAGRQIAWIPEPDLSSLLTFWPQLYASALAAGAVTTLAVLAWGERRDAVLSATALAVLPPLVLWVVSHGDVSYFYYRYLLFTLPAWVVLAGAGLTAARSRALVAAALVVVALLTLPEHQAMRKPYAHFWHGVDYEGAARTIQKYHRPGDAVVYDRGPDYWRMLDVGVRFYLPDGLRMRDVFLAESAADRNDLWSTECPDPAACVKDERRIWLVVGGNDADPFEALPGPQARALRARYTASGTERLTGVTVALLRRRS